MSPSNGKSPSGEEESGPLPDPEQASPDPSAPTPLRKKRKRRPKTVDAPKINEEVPMPLATLAGPSGTIWTPWPFWLVPLPALVGLFVLGAIAWIGWQKTNPTAKDFDLESIAIELPAHLQSQRFLEEVRYLGNLPSKLEIGNEDHLFRLKAALGKHPWVRSVDTLDSTGDGLKAKVIFRKPVLLVPVNPALSSGGNYRLVDEAGVLLPVWEQAAFPRLDATVPGPAGEPGQLWGNPSVEKAAALAGWLARQEKPILPMVIRGEPGKWILALDKRWVVWNEGPDAISQTQMAAKLARLRQLEVSTPEGTPLNLGEVTSPR